MDPLDDVFAAMRVKDAVYARFEARAPWGVAFAGGTSARFGFVVDGRCSMSVEGAPPISLSAGDCYVLVRGSKYALRDEPGSATRSCFEVVGERVGRTLEIGGAGDMTAVITGWFTFDALGARPLLDLMPVVLHARMDRSRTRIMRSTLSLLELETSAPGLGSSVIISHLADMLFIQAIRAQVEPSSRGRRGWLAALADPRLGASLRAIHDDAARAWTVASLAECAGMSRSTFAERFKDRIGEAPLEYVTRLRMFRGGALLAHGDRTLSQIAEIVGYESHAAFSKAFKRVNGCSPTSHRAMVRARNAESVSSATLGV